MTAGVPANGCYSAEDEEKITDRLERVGYVSSLVEEEPHCSHTSEKCVTRTHTSPSVATVWLVWLSSLSAVT